MNGKKNMRGGQSCQGGFTLIELMAVVVIIGIISAIAIPSYVEYIENTHRRATEGQMKSLAQALERYHAKNFSYQGATIANLVPKLNANQFYSSTLTFGNNHHSYTIKVTPIGGGIMDGDGVLILQSDGLACWGDGSTTCTPTGNGW